MWWRSVTLGCRVSKMMACTLQRAASDRSLSNGQLLKPWTTVRHNFLCPAVTARHTSAVSVWLTEACVCAFAIAAPCWWLQVVIPLRAMCGASASCCGRPSPWEWRHTRAWTTNRHVTKWRKVQTHIRHHVCPPPRPQSLPAPVLTAGLCAVFQDTVCLLLTAAPWKSPGLWTAAGSTTPETDRPSRSFGLSSAPYTTELHNTTSSSGHVDFFFFFSSVWLVVWWFASRPAGGSIHVPPPLAPFICLTFLHMRTEGCVQQRACSSGHLC